MVVVLKITVFWDMTMGYDHVCCYVFTDVSEEHTVSVFRVEDGDITFL
jgi:hypothetical protein